MVMCYVSTLGVQLSKTQGANQQSEIVRGHNKRSTKNKQAIEIARGYNKRAIKSSRVQISRCCKSNFEISPIEKVIFVYFIKVMGDFSCSSVNTVMF